MASLRSRVDRSFERLYQRHVADVYHYALAVLRNPADAEDVAQTTFLNAYRAYARGERPRSPQNWLIAIAHNVCRQRFRQTARRPREVAFEEDVATIVDDDVPSAGDISRALGHLAFNQRAALVMRELEGRTYGEIADILGISTSAVETLIFRARRALREQLEGTLTCREAEFAISRQLDAQLPRAERAGLRAHLRECTECSTFARRQRAQRSALRSIALVPLPGSLASFFGGGVTLGAGLATKAAIGVAVVAIVGGVGYEGTKRIAPSSGPAAVVAGVLTTRSVVRAEAPVAAVEAAAGPLRAVGDADGKASRSKRAQPTSKRDHASNGKATHAAGRSARSTVPRGQAKGKSQGHQQPNGVARGHDPGHHQPSGAARGHGKNSNKHGNATSAQPQDAKPAPSNRGGKNKSAVDDVASKAKSASSPKSSDLQGIPAPSVPELPGAGKDKKK